MLTAIRRCHRRATTSWPGGEPGSPRRCHDKLQIVCRLDAAHQAVEHQLVVGVSAQRDCARAAACSRSMRALPFPGAGSGRHGVRHLIRASARCVTRELLLLRHVLWQHGGHVTRLRLGTLLTTTSHLGLGLRPTCSALVSRTGNCSFCRMALRSGRSRAARAEGDHIAEAARRERRHVPRCRVSAAGRSDPDADATGQATSQTSSDATELERRDKRGARRGGDAR